MKILLGRKEVNPENPDNDGITPPSRAACWAHAGVVKIVLRQEEVYPDEPDKWGQNPLWYAAGMEMRE